MARPTKQGIDYFPLDCQFDEKIEMYLLEKGAVGLAVIIALWQMIYSNEGYYATNTKDMHLLMKKKIDVDINEISECINICLSRNIFDNCLHKKYQILTSKAIQKRFFDAAKRKKTITICRGYLLIEDNVDKNFVNVDINWIDPGGNATKGKGKGKGKVEGKVEGRNTIPPSLEMVKAYCDERANEIDAQRFVDFYESKGWVVGKERMKDWQAAIRTWEGKCKDEKKSSNKPDQLTLDTGYF